MAGRYPNVTPLPGIDIDKSDHQARDESNELKPEGLTTEQERVWDSVCFELCKHRRMKPLFVDSLREYCIIYTTLQAKRQFLNSEGWTYEVFGRNGEQIKSRPEVAHLNELWRQYNSLVAQFGLSPSTNSRFVGQAGKTLGDNGWDSV